MPSFRDRFRTMEAMSRPRLLLADDDPRVLSVVSRCLDLEGYEMSTVSDGEAAVATATADRPDLNILDIMMPGIDGIETCRQIRANAAILRREDLDHRRCDPISRRTRNALIRTLRSQRRSP